MLFFVYLLLLQEEDPSTMLRRSRSAMRRARSLPNIGPDDQRSVFSNDIWLGDRSGSGKGFTQDVSIGGWIVVGDTKSGAYIGATYLSTVS